ncbi:hypothetical protein DFH07DRAFT_765584 [Mycena maculata]|uniref:Uncharacterized protein n=1 Tax=Mycena maculata TaxID=230809 RepID=A0AAD7NYK5_9AGAR|nr:hypothetical protein DFH07DRAFT_765584 [Mycena maculata]
MGNQHAEDDEDLNDIFDNAPSVLSSPQSQLPPSSSPSPSRPSTLTPPPPRSVTPTPQADQCPPPPLAHQAASSSRCQPRQPPLSTDRRMPPGSDQLSLDNGGVHAQRGGIHGDGGAPCGTGGGSAQCGNTGGARCGSARGDSTRGGTVPHPIRD